MSAPSFCVRNVDERGRRRDRLEVDPYPYSSIVVRIYFEKGYSVSYVVPPRVVTYVATEEGTVCSEEDFDHDRRLLLGMFLEAVLGRVESVRVTPEEVVVETDEYEVVFRLSSGEPRSGG